MCWKDVQCSTTVQFTGVDLLTSASSAGAFYRSISRCWNGSVKTVFQYRGLQSRNNNFHVRWRH